MKVLVTGATGFTGSHAVAALTRQGFEVRALVRNRRKLARVMATHRCAPPECFEGDIADPEIVRQALSGCDALIHTAAFVSTSDKDREQVFRTNVEGSKRVIGTAAAQGLKRIIHVSSTAAIYQAGASSLTGQEEPARPKTSYGQSKAEAEREVRVLQAELAKNRRRDSDPVISIVYPASIVGPLDPGLSEPHEGIRIFLQRTGVLTSSGLQMVDVRDIAAAMILLLQASPCPERVTLGGIFVPWAELIKQLEQLTGRRLRKLPVPGPMLRAVGRLGDMYSNITGRATPINTEGMLYATRWIPTDDSVARSLGLEFRPSETTLADALISLAASGALSAKDIGQLATQA
ncbi:MAG: dihydroflavonol-4-reductase [Bermanella sp.]|jgi:dihydroflavonol-4-reductase